MCPRRRGKSMYDRDVGFVVSFIRGEILNTFKILFYFSPPLSVNFR